MSRHSQPRTGHGVVSSVTVMLISAIVAAAVMVFLASAAGAFGRQAFGGQTQAWFFTVAASIGVLACLLVIVVLVVRSLRMLGFIREYKPRRAASRHSKPTDPR